MLGFTSDSTACLQKVGNNILENGSENPLPIQKKKRARQSIPHFLPAQRMSGFFGFLYVAHFVLLSQLMINDKLG